MACCQQYTFTAALLVYKWIITKIYVTNHLTTTAWDQSALETTQDGGTVIVLKKCFSHLQQDSTLMHCHCSDQTHTT